MEEPRGRAATPPEPPPNLSPDAADSRPGGPLPARYRDPVRIGTGGMGAVYRAHDELLGRTVAVKVPPATVASDETARRRFSREAVAAARIHHPNVATIYDVGEHDGLPFIVMELVPGGNLEDRLALGPASREEALAWVAQAAAALDAAHAAGVVHRDVKPANLLLDGEGRVKVADFGIARVLDEAGHTLTAAGTVLGSSGYASPEQARGEPATPVSDVYSLAAVAFELLCGERPYAGRSGIAELAAHAYDPVPSAAERAPELSPRIDAVLGRGLAKDPARRYGSTGAFAAALLAAAGHGAGATAVMPAGGPPPGRSGGRRHGRRALAGVLTAAAVIGGATAVGMMASGGDDDGPAAVATRTTTPPAAAPPRTVIETVTRDAPVAPAAPVDGTPPEPTAGEAVALTDRSTAALEAGETSDGLALAERALRALAGSGESYEGNASYNRGRALIDLGRCEEAVPALERAVAVGGTDWQMRVRRAALGEARAC